MSLYSKIERLTTRISICSDSAKQPNAEGSVATDSPPAIKKRKLNSSKDVDEAIVSSLTGLMEICKQEQQRDERKFVC